MKERMKILINIEKQTLSLFENEQRVHHYLISSALNGAGEENGSEKTPRGEHIIYEKIGDKAPPNTVFVGRRPTGELYTPSLKAAFPERDWILTRILWLAGQEVGKNKFGNVDTLARYIYIHGTPDEVPMGIPGSHGCIRMRNQDLIELFDCVSVGDAVSICTSTC